MRVTVVEGTAEEIRAAFPDLAGGPHVRVEVPTEDRNASAKAAEDAALRTWLLARRNPLVAEHVEAYINALVEDDFVWVLGPSKSTEDHKADYLRFYPQGPKRVGALVYLYPRTGRVDFRAADTSYKDRSDTWARLVTVNPVAEDNKYKTHLVLTSPTAVTAAREITNHLREISTAPSGE